MTIDTKSLRALAADHANRLSADSTIEWRLKCSPGRVIELLDEVERLQGQLPACGVRPPVPWFAACAAKYGHGGMHQFPPLQSLYSKERCESCGNDRAAWDLVVEALAAKDAEIERLRADREKLAAMTAARDEACDLYDAIGAGTIEDDRVIAALRKVGAP